MEKITAEEFAAMLLIENEDVMAFEVFQTPWCDLASLSKSFKALGCFVKKEKSRSSLIVIREQPQSQHLH